MARRRFGFGLVPFLAIAGACNPPPKPPPSPVSVPIRPNASASVMPVESARKDPGPEPWLPKIASPACVLRGERGFISGVLLRLHDKPFALVPRDAIEAEVHFIAGEGLGVARFVTGEAVFAGEIYGRELPVRIRDTARAARKAKPEWIDVTFGRIAHVAADGAVTLAVELPSEVQPARPPSLTFGCADLDIFDVRTPPRRETIDTRIKPGTRAPLRIAPGGEVVAHVLAPAQPPPPKLSPNASLSQHVMAQLVAQGNVRVRVLDRKGAEARIEIDGNGASVSGWVDDNLLEKTIAFVYQDADTKFTFKMDAPNDADACKRDVPVYFRGGGTTAERVATVKAGAKIRPLEDPAGEEIPIDLGGLPDRFTDVPRPFVRKADLDGCVLRR